MTKGSPTPVAIVLTGLDVPFDQFQHPGPVNSLEQAAEERGQRPEQVVRSILFRLSDGEYLMVLVAGPNQIDWKALRQATGRSRLTTASREEVLSVTGYQVGAVGPFGLPRPLPILIDESLLHEEIISIGSGLRGTTIILRTADLQAALDDAKTVSVLKENRSADGAK